jgi:trehalose/maltose transport system permease protein
MSETKVKRGATDEQQMIGNIIAGLFAALGIGVIVFFLYSIFNNPRIAEAETTNRLILEFLDSYGLLIPLLVFGLGLTFVNFARLLVARDAIASGWAQLTAFWLMVFSIVVVFIHLFQVLTTNVGADADDRIGVNFVLVGGLIVLGAVTGFMARWLGQNREVVYTAGEETIASRESLTAWNLLIPTVAMMLLVAARPLERTFIGSLTDRTFAGAADQEVNFVGLQNYARLLGFRVDSIDCVRDEANECTTRTVTNEREEVATVAVDLDGNAALEPAALDVGLDFFLPETLNRLLAENESFKTALAAAAKAAIEEESGSTVGAVEVLSVVEGNLVEVTVDGATQQVAVTNRLTELEGLDFADVDLNYATDVSLAGLNTYRIRSRTLRDAFGAVADTHFDVENDDTIDSVAIAGFTSFDAMDVTVTHVETTNEVVYEDPRDTVGDAYRNFARVGMINLFGNRWVISARDAAFFTAIGNTLFFAFFTVIAELILGMIIALTVNSSFPGRGLMRAAMLIPWAIPTVVSAKLWEFMLLDNRAGVINDMLIRLGVIGGSVAWLANADSRIWSLIFVDVWKTTPFMALLILAGLQTIPGDIYEAADVDGAGKIRQFWDITLPLLRPTIAVALVFRTLDAVRAFDVFDVLLGRQLQSMATYNQFVLVETQEFGYASAIGVTMFVIIMVFTIIYVRALGVDTD